MSLYNVYVEEPYCRSEFIEETPIIIGSCESNLVETSILNSSNDIILPCEIELNLSNNQITETIAPAKKIYIKTTQEQIEILKSEWSMYSTSKFILYYVEKTGIRPSRIKEFIRRLKKGENIDKSKVKKSRHRKIGLNESEKLVNMILDINRISLREMRQQLLTENCNVSISTIHTHLTSRMNEYNLPIITLKRYLQRDERANIPTLKDDRIVVVKKLNTYISKGYRPIYVDESHWDLGLLAGRARSPIGETPICYAPNSDERVTVIASMSDLGMGYCQVITGGNDREVFISRLTNSVKNTGKRLFFMDNVRIHHDLAVYNLVKSSGNELLYNAVYSSPLNPIEYIFGIWKVRSERYIRNYSGINDF